MTRKRKISRPRLRVVGKAVHKTAATTKSDPLYEFIENGTRSLNLKVEKSWLPAIGAHLLTIWQHGVLVESFALSDEIDPAPVFEP